MEKSIVHGHGSAIGGALLIGGCCIGGGMFALPVVAGMSGFGPSLLLFTLAWAFMVTTAFFIQRVIREYSGCSSFLSLARKSLGPLGETVVFFSFISLFFSLVIAYFVKGGGLVQGVIGQVVNVPACSGPILLAIATYFLLVKGIRFIDSLNKVFMIGLAATFLYLTFLGNQNRDFSFVRQHDWGYSASTFSFLVISFGFHNIIPSLNMHLGESERRVKKAILLGAMLPFVVYLVWLAHFLSLVPYSGPVSIVNSYQSGQIASEVLGRVLSHSHFAMVLEGFAFFAIITSLLAQVLSLQDFIQDGFSRLKVSPKRGVISMLIIVPALSIAVFNPNIFFQLLEIGGGIITIILFGIVPGLMVLKIKGLKRSWFFASNAILGLSMLILAFEFWNLLKH